MEIVQFLKKRGLDRPIDAPKARGDVLVTKTCAVKASNASGT
jgi:hypothetical protein